MRGFKNFLMRGDVIVVAVGLVVALAFSSLITAFTTYIISPIVAAAGGKSGLGLGFYVSDHNPKTFVDFGKFISAIIYFIIWYDWLLSLARSSRSYLFFCLPGRVGS